ncbi:hypothetical protein H2198_005182 [Neophaeococcomyces mojaviensis]|uniref:Uncharacterized protein n=1 Tax=Neophaeococcomyces mojaviensis TaxID=3383035 RepID=A0ACC3A792_9EURO|nr:hypothetical protein H2198_005182 [Knufia sp. JES_112]
MPIYALTLYGVFPAFVAEDVYVRAPQRMTELMHRLEPLLNLETYFPNLKIVFAGRDKFVQDHVTSADVVIFTGKLANAQQVLRKCKKNSLFLFNGWGCNPIVVGEGADLDTAAEKTVQARLFSSGQDCAGPDTVLVSRQDADEFTTKLKEHLASTTVGPYTDRNVVVGPLADAEQIRLIGSVFLRVSDQIVHGGTIDYGTSIIHPTIIVSNLTQYVNFEELFAPVIFVSIYEDASQLREYFEHPSYIANEMYVTLFGSCDYVESLKRSIIVRNKVIFDIDRGNDEFGGYSMGASFVASNRRITPKPILVPREIHDYLQPGSAGYKLSPNAQAKIGKQVRKAMTDFFSSNLVFGFVFGSIARQQATGSSDVNTMVVLEKKDDNQIDSYTTWLRHLHEQYQLVFKEQSSAVILTVSELNQLVAQLDSSGRIPCGSSVSSVSIPTEALSGTQCGVGGNKKLSVEYGRRVMPYSTTVQKKKPSLPADLKLQEYPPQVRASPEEKVVDSDSSKTEDDLPLVPSKDFAMTGLTHQTVEVNNVPSFKSGKIKWIQDLCRKCIHSMDSAKVLRRSVKRCR